MPTIAGTLTSQRLTFHVCLLRVVSLCVVVACMDTKWASMIRDAHKIFQSLQRMMMKIIIITNIISELAPVPWSPAPEKKWVFKVGDTGALGEVKTRRTHIFLTTKCLGHWPLRKLFCFLLPVCDRSVLCNEHTEEISMHLFWDCSFAMHRWNTIAPNKKRGLSSYDEICLASLEQLQ